MAKINFTTENEARLKVLFVELGFKLITPFTDLESFLRKVQVEHFDWCILSLEHMGNINLAELINNLYKSSCNKLILISIIHRIHIDIVFN